MSGPFKMKNSGLAYSAKHKSPIEYASPVKHAPYAPAHTKAEGKVAHQNTAEAHGKKSEDYYDGSKGKVIQSTGATRSAGSQWQVNEGKEEEK